jgi:hypothetical protein
MNRTLGPAADCAWGTCDGFSACCLSSTPSRWRGTINSCFVTNSPGLVTLRGGDDLFDGADVLAVNLAQRVDDALLPGHTSAIAIWEKFGGSAGRNSG